MDDFTLKHIDDLENEVRNLQAERESREWWAVHGGSVHRVIGYSCAPHNPHYWWVPTIGYSLSDEHHLFATQDAALGWAVNELERLTVETQERITALRIQRSLL